MGQLRSFLAGQHGRLLIVSACSAKKADRGLDRRLLLREGDLDDPARRRRKEAELARYVRPACDMYLGDGHRYVRNAVQLLTSAGYKTSHYILSAGYGLIRDDEVVAPYDVTFNGKPKKWIRERGHFLGLATQLRRAAQNHSHVVLILGRDYLAALGIPLPVGDLPATLAYIAPAYAQKLGEGIRWVAVTRELQMGARAYSSLAKEKCFWLDVKEYCEDKGVL